MSPPTSRPPTRLPVRIDPVAWEASLRAGTPADRRQAIAWREQLGEPPQLTVVPGVLRPCRDDEATDTYLAGCRKLYLPDPGAGDPPSRWRVILLPIREEHGIALDFLAFGKGHPGANLPAGQRRGHQPASAYRLAHLERIRRYELRRRPGG